jgi:hypothetical protein
LSQGRVLEYKKIDRRTFDFSLQIIEFYKFLQKKQEYVLSKQLLRRGASIGANIEEVQPDEANYLKEFPVKKELPDEIHSIINTVTKIVKTTAGNH